MNGRRQRFEHGESIANKRRWAVSEEETKKMNEGIKASAQGTDQIDISERDRDASADLQTITQLAQLSRLEYDRVRKGEAERLRIQLSTLDAEVERRRPAKSGGSAASISILENVEPWPQAVDGAELLEQLSAVYRSHLALPESAADAAALWVLHTYALDAAQCSPFLTWQSPTPRCGKTTAQAITAALAARAILTSNISAAALFRFMDRETPTLILDEGDTYLKGNDELRGVLNAGHTRDAAYVIRCDGPQFEPRRFCTWGAKSIALIGKLPPTLHDRSIVISMRRKLAGERVASLPSPLKETFKGLRRMCLRWTNDSVAQLNLIRPAVPQGLHDRAADNWKPLLAIAEMAGGDWPSRARVAAAALSAVGQVGVGVGEQLLADIRDLFSSRQTDRLRSQEIATALARLEGRPWPDWKAGKPISATQIARLLSDFVIVPKPIRVGGQPTKGYELSQFEDAFARYLSVETVTQLHPHEGKHLSDLSSVTALGFVTDGDFEIPAENGLRNRVTDQNEGGCAEGVEETF
jgi:putative DNA primase/helicase